MEILVGVLVVIALFVLGWVVIGLAIKLVWWLLIGIVIGALARLIVPGEQRIGVLATALYGAGGALQMRDGVLHVIDAAFVDDQAEHLGPDVGGGAIYVNGALGAIVVGVAMDTVQQV